MADTKTSDELDAGTLDGTELVRIVQAGSNRKTTTQDIADLATGGGGGPTDAEYVDVTDAGGYFTGTNVEDVLQEIGATLGGIGGGGGSIGWLNYVWPVGASPSSGTTAGQGTQANLVMVILPHDMKVSSLGAQLSATGDGSFQWGLFDFSEDATSCTKLVGGTTSGGVVSDNPADTETLVPAGVYALITHWTVSSVPTYYYTGLPSVVGAPKLRGFQNSYTWDDTPNITTGWSFDSNVLHHYLKGSKINSDGAIWG